MLEWICSRALNPDVGDVCGVGGNAPAAAADSPGVGKLVVNFGFLPESVLPESMQDGSPTVIVGPKLLLPSLSSKHLIGLSTTRVSRRFDSGVPLEGGTTTSAMTFTPATIGYRHCWLPSLLSSLI